MLLKEDTVWLQLNILDVEPACSIGCPGRPKHAEGPVPDRPRSFSMETASVSAGENKKNKISPHVILHFNLSPPPPQTGQTASSLQRCRDGQRETEHIRPDPIAEQREGCCHVVAQTLVGVDVTGGEEHLAERNRNTERKSMRNERSIITRPHHLCWGR